MQPYFFPYLGYFQLIAACDLFVFYDDVNFIKRGWINRNRIGLNNSEFLLTVPCVKPSQNKLIKDTEVNFSSELLEKNLQTFRQAYLKSPNYEVVLSIYSDCFKNVESSISSIAIKSIKLVADYLEINTKFVNSSEQNYDNDNLKKADRLIDICHIEGYKDYLNAKGGMDIYDKEYFKERQINLNFLDPILTEYHRAKQDYIPGLSILDILAYLSKEEAREMCHRINII